MADRKSSDSPAAFSRRNFLATTGLGIAAASSVEAMLTSTARAQSRPGTAPFDSLRDYVEALENHGLLLRFDRVDQDAFEGTAIMYRLMDRYGRFAAPAVMFEQVKINGTWIDGPVIANHLRHSDIEGILLGIDPIPGNPSATFQNSRTHLNELLAEGGGTYPTLAPNEVTNDQAPCKEVVLHGDDIDLTRFPFFQNNPGDSGRYVNTAAVFTQDPDIGVNFGTYRCELTGPHSITVSSGEGQTGNRMFMAAKERGEKTTGISLVLGQDPIVWMISGTRIGQRRGNTPVDELAIAGGLRGKALDVVRSETNDLLVPAHAEMVIEGEVNLEEFVSDGPYGEGVGYIGKPYHVGLALNVTTVTHRRDPWFVNDFTGVSRAILEGPSNAIEVSNLKLFFPDVVDYRFHDGVVVMSIDKKEAGQGLKVGKALAELVPVYKIIMVVDADVDVMNPADVFMAFATRWQPHPASHIYEDLAGWDLDPSSPAHGRTSKIVMDMTRQWPEEGGPESYPEYSRDVLEREAPDIFDQVDAKWTDVINGAFGS